MVCRHLVIAKLLELSCLSFGLMDRQVSFATMLVAVYSSRIEIYPPAPECIKVPNMPQVKTTNCIEPLTVFLI